MPGITASAECRNASRRACAPDKRAAAMSVGFALRVLWVPLTNS